MRMELLKFNKGGQWSLIHKDEENGYPPDLDFMSYRNHSRQGMLPRDYGQKGSLHNVGNRRAKPQMSENRMKAKVPLPVDSSFADRNPGLKPL